MGNPKSWENSRLFFPGEFGTYHVIRMVDCFHASIGRVEEALSKRVVEPNVNRGGQTVPATF